jgi:hypothetical protein
VVVSVGDGEAYYGPYWPRLRLDNGHDVILGHVQSTLVATGARFEPGDVIAKSGDLGVSSNCHLHVEMRPAGGGYFTDIDPHPFLNGPLLASSAFDADFYLSEYPDLQAHFGHDTSAARDHWIQHGIREGRRGSPAFGVRFYLSRYADLRTAFGTNYAAAVNHWATQGLPKEGRSGSLEFDVQFYLARYGDLREAFGDNYAMAADHWVTQGLPKEGRRGSPDFDVQAYLSRYPDLARAFDHDYAEAFRHWINTGIREGRSGAP